MLRALISISLALLTATSARAADLGSFSENFEQGLTRWVDRTPQSPEAVITTDPFNTSNHVLSFVKTGSGGSVFTIDRITTLGQFTVSFDYLGLATPADKADLGGFFGVSTILNPTDATNHVWVAGTGSFPAPIHLVDDGLWHTYTLTFSSAVGQPVHLMFEDFNGSGPVAGDVYFDNVRFNAAAVTPAVPEPGTMLLMACGLAMLGLRTARR